MIHLRTHPKSVIRATRSATTITVTQMAAPDARTMVIRERRCAARYCFRAECISNEAGRRPRNDLAVDVPD